MGNPNTPPTSEGTGTTRHPKVSWAACQRILHDAWPPLGLPLAIPEVAPCFSKCPSTGTKSAFFGLSSVGWRKAVLPNQQTAVILHGSDFFEGGPFGHDSAGDSCPLSHIWPSVASQVASAQLVRRLPLLGALCLVQGLAQDIPRQSVVVIQVPGTGHLRGSAAFLPRAPSPDGSFT